MRKLFALIRATGLTALSYRLNIATTIGTLIFQVVPMYYIGHTLQPFMGPSIKTEGADYFSFLVVGTAGYLILAAAVDSLPRAISKGISTGTLEALFGTPTPVPTLVAGLTGYEILWTATKAGLVLGVGALAGAHIAWSRMPLAILIFALLFAAYAAVGLVCAALIVAFRSAGPLQTVALVGSGLLGGVTYPTSMVPGWLHGLTNYVPLTYGLRAMRRLLIDVRPVSSAIADIGILTAFAAVGLIVGSICFYLSLQYARRAGSLAQY